MFKTIAKKYRKNTSGNVAVMFGAAAFVLVGGLALGVDVTNAYYAEQRLQQTTDAVALLAAKDKSLDTDEKLQAAAQALYDATYPGQTGVRIEIDNIRRDGDQVIIDATNNIDTYFGGIFNRRTLDIGVTSTATFTQRSIDVALVLDTTGSMGQRVAGDPSGVTKIQSLKTAANGLVDTLEGSGASKVRLSVVPFAQYVNVGQTHARAQWLDLDNNLETQWTGCVGSRVNGFDETSTSAGGPIPAAVGATCGSALQPMTDDYNALQTSINNLTARGLTYIPSGITWGWRTLEGELPTQVADAPNDTVHKKVMVIMTDGENTRSKSGLAHNGRSLANANRKTADLCNSVKGDDIEVYTIGYSLTNQETIRLMQDCASDADNYFDARTAADLNRAFQAIGSELDVLRISS